MRFLDLRLTAFGPFTDLTLDLSARGGRGLHLIYGRNAAGKSTSLRAVRGLLFGIPGNTRDAHLHPMNRLRIGARLVGGDGKVLDVVRRKGRKNTLADTSGERVDEADLKRLLHGAGEELFNTMFGLDAVSLRRGAEALLAGEGDVGEGLYDASLGGNGTHAVLERLHREADELFTPQARTRELNESLRELRDAQKRSRELAKPADKWLEQRRAIDARARERDELSDRLHGLREEQNRLQRARRVLPLVAQRMALAAEHAEHGVAPVLPDRAPERRQTAQQEMRECSRKLEWIRDEMDRLMERRTQLVVPDALLRLEDVVVEQLHQGLGRHRKAAGDLIRQRGKTQQLENEAVAVLRELGLDGGLERAQQLRIGTAMKERIRKLGLERAGIEERLGASQRSREQLASSLDDDRVRLEQIATSDGRAQLDAAYEGARRAGDLEARLVASTVERKRVLSDSARALRALRLWQGPLAEVSAVAVPTSASVERFIREWSAIERLLAEVESSLSRVEEELLDTSSQIEASRRGGTVPSLDHLAAARKRRGAGFALLRKAWLEGQDVTRAARGYDRERPIDEAYAEAVRVADAVADQMRDEAEEVSRLAALEEQRAVLQARRRSFEGEQREAASRFAALDRDWRELWSEAGIEPLPPVEMREWLQRHGRLCERVARLEQLETEEKALRLMEERHRRSLGEALAAAGVAVPAPASGYDVLLDRAAIERDRLAESERERRELQRRVAEAEVRCCELVQRIEAESKERERWLCDWSESVAGLELDGSATPEEADAVIDRLSQLARVIEEHENKSRRIVAMERDAFEFRAEVERLVALCAPDLAALEWEQAAGQLVARHDKARKDHETRLALDADLAEKGQAREELERRESRARAELRELIAAARVDDAAALEAAEQEAAASAERDRRLEDIEREIMTAGEGRVLEELLDEVRDLEADPVAVRLRELEDEVSEADEALAGINADIGGLQTGLDHYDGGEAAAEAAVEAQAWVERARRLAMRYVRLKLAAVILEREVERYRERNQGPVLRRAGELFPRLSMGDFAALKVALNARDEAELRCVTPDSEEKTVAELSTGRRDQLYLALRLASLERYMASNEAMPLILDDVLINFDDMSSRAALEILGEMADDVQILFFTHHQRQLELAREAVPDDRLFEHRLHAAGK